jgi:hypothetical protein
MRKEAKGDRELELYHPESMLVHWRLKALGCRLSGSGQGPDMMLAEY